MSTTPTPVSSPRAAEDANAAIRTFVADRVVWSQADLAELARLRRAWMAAVQRGAVTQAA
jgi:hypothetical protein